MKHIAMGVIHLLCVIVVALGQAGILPHGAFATPDMQGTWGYGLNMACVVLTLACVPAVVGERKDVGKKWLGNDMLRLLLPTVVVLLGISTYYLTLTYSGLLCAAICYLILWYSYATTIRRHRQL